MAAVLLGVTGGIAAYKACELTRLLVKAGHEVTPLLTPGAERFVTRADLRGARAPAGERGPLPASARADLLVVAPLLGEHARQARARHRRQRPHPDRARVSGAGARRAGDERAHVGAPGDAGERRDAARARRRADRARRGRARRGRDRRRPDDRAGGDLRARPGAARPGGARRAGASSSPPAGRGSRSTPSASSATAPRAAWASRSPRRRAAAAPT